MKCIGLMATYPPRRKSLLFTLQCLARQLDEIHIYLNGYTIDDIAELADSIDQSTNSQNLFVHLVDQGCGDGDLRDMGKFWHLPKEDAFVFLLDDDMWYPADYIDKHIDWITKLRCITSVHGRYIKRYPLTSYFSDTKSVNYKRELTDPLTLDIAGTGTVAFSTDDLQLDRPTDQQMRDYAGMADIWFSCRSKKAGVRIAAIPRMGNWLKSAPDAGGLSLYDEMRHRTSVHCQKMNEVFR